MGATAPAWSLLVSPVLALFGVVIGASLPRLFEQRREAQARYDDAITAVAQLQAHRHGAGVNVPSHFIKPVDAAAEAKVLQELSTDGLRRFLESAAAARAALAALHPFSPDLKPYWDKFEVSEAELDSLVATLRVRRRHPTHRVRRRRVVTLLILSSAS